MNIGQIIIDNNAAADPEIARRIIANIATSILNQLNNPHPNMRVTFHMVGPRVVECRFLVNIESETELEFAHTFQSLFQRKFLDFVG
jgi:hypothetical protein